MVDFLSKININNPFCLYCNSECDIKSWGDAGEFCVNFTCNSCKEIFEFIYEEENLISTVFTCNNLEIAYLKEIDHFGIRSKKILDNETLDSEVLNRTWVPSFDINFKDKNSLFNKFINYLIF